MENSEDVSKLNESLKVVPSAEGNVRHASKRVTLWLLITAVNLFDAMGLFYLTPTGPLHVIKPYIKYINKV